MPGYNQAFKMYQSALSKMPHKATTGTLTIDRYGCVIPVDTTAGAATLTLAQPTKAGILGGIVLTVDGGDVTLTVTGGYNSAGDTSITLADAGDCLFLYSIDIGSTYYWRLIKENFASELTMGAGFTSGVGGIAISSIEHIGSIYKTTIFMDLTGLSSSTTDLDIIGVGLLPAHFGQIIASRNGTLFHGEITCLETPAGGVTDIDFYSATEGTGVFDGGIAALTETVLRTNGGAWSAAAATPIELTAVPAAGQYMYVVGGAAGTAAAYTAGQFKIELWGS